GFRAVCRLNNASFAVHEDAIPGHHTNLHPAPRQQAVESAVAVLVQQCFNLSGCFVPTLLEGGLADVLRHYHVSGIEFAVTDNLDARDVGDLLPDQLKDRAAEVPSDALVGFGPLEPGGQEGVVEPLAARGEAVHLRHAWWALLPCLLRFHVRT